MNDDSVGSIATGIWTPQNLKCINCCFLSLMLSYGSDKSSVLPLKNNSAFKVALCKKSPVQVTTEVPPPTPPGTTVQPGNKQARKSLIFNLKGLFWKKSPFRLLFIELNVNSSVTTMLDQPASWIFQQVWYCMRTKKKNQPGAFGYYWSPPTNACVACPSRRPMGQFCVLSVVALGVNTLLIIWILHTYTLSVLFYFGKTKHSQFSFPF